MSEKDKDPVLKDVVGYANEQLAQISQKFAELESVIQSVHRMLFRLTND